MKKEVVIVGGDPARLATATCLNALYIPNVVLEEDCYTHLWKKRTYDQLKLHLVKEFCALPHMPHPDSTPTYMAKDDFVRYLDQYVAKFDISPVCNTLVELASYDGDGGVWFMKVRDATTGEEYVARFLVVAMGENAEGFMPDVLGLKGFHGEVTHSCRYKSGVVYSGKRVLVVGSGNSGMEIAYDLANYGAMPSIVIRSPVC